MKDKQRLRVLENRVMRKIFGSRRTRQQENREDYVTRSIMICKSAPLY
jgi:hypothetical protein